MRKTLKRIALGIALLLFAFVVLVGGALAQAFRGNAPLPQAAGPVRDSPVILIPDGYVAVYAIPTGPDHVALVDCGNDGEAKAVKAWLEANKKTLDAIFLTHGHPDHINGCHALPKVPIHAMSEEVALIKGDVAFRGPLPRAMGPTHANVIVDRPLRDGDTVTVGDTAIRAHLVTGHTPGSAVYVAHGVAIFGDAATGAADGSVKAPPWIFSDDVPQAASSLRALARALEGAGVQNFAYAHAGPQPADLKKLAAAQ